MKKLASQKGVVVGGKYCQLELGRKPEPGNGWLIIDVNQNYFSWNKNAVHELNLPQQRWNVKDLARV